MDPRHVVVLGKKTGVTRLTFWFENNPEPLVLFVIVPPVLEADTGASRTSAKDDEQSQ